METSASFEARYAPLPYPTNQVERVPRYGVESTQRRYDLGREFRVQCHIVSAAPISLFGKNLLQRGVRMARSLILNGG